ncbi:putative exosome complex exonuclease RRP41, partial [Operophtera brumata]
MPGPDLLSSQGLRLDGRRPNELRRIRCKLGVFTQPDGSAYLEQGNTKVLAAVYGPHQASKSKVSTDGVVVNCQYRERKNRPRGDRKSTEMSLHLRQALTAAIKTELYPRSQIDIYIEVLQAYACACSASMSWLGPQIVLDKAVREHMADGWTNQEAASNHRGDLREAETHPEKYMPK